MNVGTYSNPKRNFAFTGSTSPWFPRVKQAVITLYHRLKATERAIRLNDRTYFNQYNKRKTDKLNARDNAELPLVNDVDSNHTAMKELGRGIAEARIWLERGDVDGAQARLDGLAAIIPNPFYPSHDEVAKEMDADVNGLMYHVHAELDALTQPAVSLPNKI
jgi:hypothetical protein